MIHIFIWVLSLNKMPKAELHYETICLCMWYLLLSIFPLHGSFYSHFVPEQSNHWSEINKKMLIVRDMQLSKSCHSRSRTRYDQTRPIIFRHRTNSSQQQTRLNLINKYLMLCAAFAGCLCEGFTSSGDC